jgi:ATP-binding cassette subfamily B protein
MGTLWHDAVLSRWDIVRTAPKAGAVLLAAGLFVAVILGVLPVAFIVATSVMIGRVPAAVAAGIGSDEWFSLIAAFGLAAGAFLLQQILAPVQTALGELIRRRVDGIVVDGLIGTALGSPGIGPLEDQALLDDLAEARRSFERDWLSPGNAVAGLVALQARYAQLVGMVTVIWLAFRWWAALAVAATVMLFRYGQRGGLRRYTSTWVDNARPRRESWYFRELGTEASAAKEIRIFGLLGWVKERYRRMHLAWVMPVWAHRRKIYLWPYLVYTTIGLTVAATMLALLGRSAARGEVSLAALALTIQAVIAAIHLGEYYPESDVPTQFGMRSLEMIRRFEAGVEADRVEVAGRAAAQAATDTADPAGLPQQSLRFEGVHFAYPGSERAVLAGLDLEIPAGKSTAIVGLNGAGKTTLVKLLGRLYEPTSGRITADGTDLRTFPLEAWRQRIGIVFQDFNHYELSAADNIAFGAIHRADDRPTIEHAARQAGILRVLEGLPRGLDSPLSRQYEGGADLSGGQWQRVAIARALFALEGGSSILVLDEPTAALDVRAEAAFFDQFVELTRGVTTLLISHRFSSVRHADHIVVLSGGQLLEQGSHNELVEAGGTYAELFHVQAERYLDDAATGPDREVAV